MGLNETEKAQADGISFLGSAFEEPWWHPAECAIAKIEICSWSQGGHGMCSASHDTSGPLIQWAISQHAKSCTRKRQGRGLELLQLVEAFSNVWLYLLFPAEYQHTWLTSWLCWRGPSASTAGRRCAGNISMSRSRWAFKALQLRNSMQNWSENLRSFSCSWWWASSQHR